MAGERMTHEWEPCEVEELCGCPDESVGFVEEQFAELRPNRLYQFSAQFYCKDCDLGWMKILTFCDVQISFEKLPEEGAECTPQC